MRPALVALVCMVGCGVPDLDRRGGIRCGAATDPNGGCPTGFACNADRCCPPGATDCPRLPASCEGHQVAPFAAGSPPAECGVTVPIGRACTMGDRGTCPLLHTCSTTFPGGYCTLALCTGAVREACEREGGACVTYSGLAISAVCVMRCTLPTGESIARCRNDQPGRYVCVRVVTRTLNETLCIPDCVSTPTICTGGSVCNPRTHQCEGATEM